MHKNDTLKKKLTNEIEVIIRELPDAPKASLTSPFSANRMVGLIDDIGRFPGLIKFGEDGAMPSEFRSPGVEKLSIWLLSTTPVVGDMNFDPNLP